MTTAAPMLLTYKYRLCPEARQHRALERILEQQRQLYNAALEERIEAYRQGATKNRGGPVPGGASQDANADAGPRRPGNTEAEKSAPARRGHSPLLTHVRGARDPRLRRSSGW